MTHIPLPNFKGRREFNFDPHGFALGILPKRSHTSLYFLRPTKDITLSFLVCPTKDVTFSFLKKVLSHVNIKTS